MTLQDLKENNQAPIWMTEEGFKTLTGNYLLEGETPADMYSRIAKAAAKHAVNDYTEKSQTEWEHIFYDAMWKNWLCPASPILSNMGTDRGLPISCNSIHLGDSVDSIFMKSHELAMLSKHGAGVGVYVGDIRGRGAEIKGNGKSEGVIPWMKIFDTAVTAVNQGSTRRGAAAVYLPIEHTDIEEFINIRKPTGDMNRRCLNLNHGICITDDWMNKLIAGDKDKRKLWQEILVNRISTGEPYLFFSDNINKKNPECYKANNLEVKTSNICCLAGETLVLTQQGPKRIDSLINKTVTIWDGLNWVKNNTFEKRGEDSLIRIWLKDGTYVDSNALHRWFVSKTYSDIRNNKVSLVHTKDLVLGQWLEYHTQQVHGNKKVSGAYLKGFLLGDWVTDYKKELPADILSWDKESKLLFLSGLLDAAGTIGKYCTIQLSSIHKNFIYSLQQLIKTFGYAASIDTKVSSDRNTLHRLTISSLDGYHLLQSLTCKRLFFAGKKPNRRLTGYRQITKIEKLEGVYPVYCPVLPTTGKFALANGLMTGNTEITLYTDSEHTFVCCLSSLNLAKWAEWKDTDLPKIATRFLDAVISEYIDKTQGIKGLENSRRSALKGRAIGIGVLGWHTLLQENNIAFDSFQAMMLNAEIFKTIKEKSENETAQLAKEFGEPEWCTGFNRRNTHLIAVAPTVSNSLISGGVSAGIEPLVANSYAQKSAKGTFIRKNPTLEKLLVSKNLPDLDKIWKSINEHQGSVQHLTCLTVQEKEIFLTAREINQHAIIRQAAQRQKWIDQAQSVNLFFAANSDPKYIHEVHLEAWKSGLKTLYYCRSEGVIKGDMASRSKDECTACEG